MIKLIIHSFWREEINQQSLNNVEQLVFNLKYEYKVLGNIKKHIQ